MQLSPLAYKIINTTIFKRLKNLKQLGNSHEVFPSGNHTRFEHSLGVMHIGNYGVGGFFVFAELFIQLESCVRHLGELGKPKLPAKINFVLK